MDPLCKVDPDFIVLEEKAKHTVLRMEGVTLIILESMLRIEGVTLIILESCSR